MKVIDLHSDIITDIAFRRERGERKVFERIHYPVLRKSGLLGLICAIWVEPIYQGNEYFRFHQILQYALDDFKESSKVKIVKSKEDIQEAETSGQFFILLGLEGLTFMEDWKGKTPREKVSNAVQELNPYVSHAIFAWNEQNFVASGTGAVTTVQAGLTETGKALINQMDQAGWIVDVSHLDKPSFWDVVSHYNGPLLASHSNARKLCDVERNLDDEQIRAVGDSAGLIGVNVHGPFVSDTSPSIDHVIDHVTYIASITSIEQVGFGFDFTNYLESYSLGQGFNHYTKGLEDASKIPDLADRMLSRGFTQQEVEKVCFDNAFRFLTKNL
ncbi:MAG: membrane dipeptidase [Bacillaceae bacterium]|nr:membrane dipeptidase [Bacillaceae bacterium]